MLGILPARDRPTRVSKGSLESAPTFVSSEGLPLSTHTATAISQGGRTSGRSSKGSLRTPSARSSRRWSSIRRTVLPGINTTAPFISESLRGTESKSFTPPKRYRTGLRALFSRALWKVLRNTTQQSSLRKSSVECTRAL